MSLTEVLSEHRVYLDTINSRQTLGAELYRHGNLTEEGAPQTRIERHHRKYILGSQRRRQKHGRNDNGEMDEL